MHTQGPNQTEQLVCPNCQGGNPAVARVCMWCGKPLAQAFTGVQLSAPPRARRSSATTGSYYAPPPVQLSSAPVAPARFRPSAWKIVVGAIAVLLVCGIIGSFNRASQSGQNARNNSTAKNTSSNANGQNQPTSAGEPDTSSKVPANGGVGGAQATLDPAQQAAATQTASFISAGDLPQNSETYLYANETSHSVSVFAPTYLELGGAVTIGFPITELFVEQNPTDGKGYWVQYFEKAVFEYHHSMSGADAYQLAALGSWRYTQKYATGAPATKPLPGPETYLFQETDHTVADPFLSFWKAKGQVRRFGYPISESFEEISDADGRPYIVQYFERAVMEYHPELPVEHQVQLTALGAQKHAQLYPNGAPMTASLAIPSPTINATATTVAAINATSTTETANANATATAVQAERDAAATAQRARVNSTHTAEAEAASAAATAERKKYDTYINNAPQGDFQASGSDVAIACKVEYQRCVGDYWCADNNSKYILVGVTVYNIGNGTVHVNPLNFTLESTDGATVSADTGTYSLGNYLDAVDIRPGTHTSGWIAFLTTKKFIPGNLVWREIFGETVEVPIVKPLD
jgi:hypothetical protein